MYIDKLKSLITPPPMPSNTGGLALRDEINKKIGIELPEDYYQIIETYGTGCFSNNLVVYNPYTDNPNLNLFVQIKEWGYGYNTLKEEFGDQTNGEEGLPFEFYPSKNGLIPWGWTEGGGFTFYWIPEKNKWSIVVYDEAECYKKFDMTISEFIYKLMKGEVEFYDLCDHIPENQLMFQKY